MLLAACNVEPLKLSTPKQIEYAEGPDLEEDRRGKVKTALLQPSFMTTITCQTYYLQNVKQAYLGQLYA